MESGSSLEKGEKVEKQKGSKLGSMLPNIEPFVPRKNFYDPRELRSWAKRTGFVSTTFSIDGEATSSKNKKNHNNGIDLEKGVSKHVSSSPPIDIDPNLVRNTKNRDEIEPVLLLGNGKVGDEDERTDRTMRGVNKRGRMGFKHALGDRFDERIDENGNGGSNVNNHGVSEIKKEDKDDERERETDYYPGGVGENGGSKEFEDSPLMKCGMRENPGYGQLIWYGLQHYLSLAGSLIFIPLIMVPTMGGSDKDTSTVISTMLLVSGITTILHTLFGTRLPLIQGSSFVYLAPALVIMNSREHRNLTQHKFSHIMKELQGAIIVGSSFQTILGLSGLMSFFMRLINPVVVAPTIVALGLAFFAYGFPQAGDCVEISLPLIILLLIFTLYLRGVSIYGHRVFRIYAVPLSVVIIWAYAFFLTTGGAYNFKGCNPNIPSSNIVTEACIRHAYTMKHCRTDISNAIKTSPWVRVPYPLQWGLPIFRLRTSIIMIVVSLVASINSMATYHSLTTRINMKPPTRAIVNRGIGIEGFCSILAGLWGTGTGSTTLTENIHTIDVTKVANRRAVQIGAAFLILFSFIGKIGGILASIPQALAAAVLCFIWSLMIALGLSRLQYTQSASFRNVTIIGVSIFLGFSIPAYFQQYQPKSALILPRYLVQYAAASDGPINTRSTEVDFAMNALMSLNMVVTLLVAFILDNTVPGSKQERGVYEWSSVEDIAADSSAFEDYKLPSKVGRFFRWAKCLGI